MFKGIDITDELTRTRSRHRHAEDKLVSEAKRILQQDLFSDRKILSNLRQYNESLEVVDEDLVDPNDVFTLDEIKKVAVKYRLKLLDSQLYKPELPYAALMKIRQMNREQRREIKEFKILTCPNAFRSRQSSDGALLFARTNYDNYYLVLQWGNRLGWFRRLLYWPLRSFEALLLTVITFTLLLTLSLPTNLITLDAKAEYWSGYRGAAFFHLLIFNLGFTTYFTFAFSRNFSKSVWDRLKDFD